MPERTRLPRACHPAQRPAETRPRARRRTPLSPPQADIWSCGVILYILLSGCPPFDGATDEEVYQAILSREPFMGAYWDHISPAAKDCVRRMLVRPGRRACCR